ncbi:MAG: DUF1667 domain-containing protein [Lachnospiraceae bacterium]|nr:DUF1667 domain-containing protein [Lachnospiraceae bacterium]
METKEFTCIICPLGCNVVATLEDGKIVSITGNTCPRGAEYVTNELTDPKRIVTALVKVTGGENPVVSVKTAADIPKGKIFECLDALKSVNLKAPVRIGDVVIKNVCDCGVDVVATSNVR